MEGGKNSEQVSQTLSDGRRADPQRDQRYQNPANNQAERAKFQNAKKMKPQQKTGDAPPRPGLISDKEWRNMTPEQRADYMQKKKAWDRKWKQD